MRNGHINNVKKDQAIDKSLINYNLIINNLNTHHNKETKLLRVNASRLSWIPRISKQAYRPVWSTGCSAERVINSARKHVWVRFAHIKRDGVPTYSANSIIDNERDIIIWIFRDIDHSKHFHSFLSNFNIHFKLNPWGSSTYL